MSDQQLGTLVIGGSQAGLAVGYYLRQHRLPFAILDDNDRIGDAWRARWDSLRLFTPGRYDGLPGMRFPGSPSSFPTKDETADYLETYAREFDLPVQTGTRVDRLAKAGTQFEVFCGEDRLLAENVVVATGAFSVPRIPPFARDLDENILQLHSREYRNPSQIQDGGVLVVGAGNSGAEIAIELAPDHQVWLSGRDTGQEPTRAGSLPDRVVTPIMWLVATRLTVKSRWGRKLRDRFFDPPRGIPLGRVRRKDFAAAGIERVPRVTGVRNGYPVLEDGRILEVANVVWCTGFTQKFDWIDLPLPMHNGFPIHERGVVTSCPGVYFVGLPFLYSLSSALVGGVGRDAEHIVAHIHSARGARSRRDLGEDQPAQPQHKTARGTHTVCCRHGRRYGHPAPVSGAPPACVEPSFTEVPPTPARDVPDDLQGANAFPGRHAHEQSTRVLALTVRGNGLNVDRFHRSAIGRFHASAFVSYTCRCAVRWPRG